MMKCNASNPLNKQLDSLFAGKSNFGDLGSTVVALEFTHAMARANVDAITAAIPTSTFKAVPGEMGAINWQAIIAALETTLTGLVTNPVLQTLLQIALSLLPALIPAL